MKYAKLAEFEELSSFSCSPDHTFNSNQQIVICNPMYDSMDNDTGAGASNCEYKPLAGTKEEAKEESRVRKVMRAIQFATIDKLVKNE